MENGKLRILVIGAHPDDCESKTGGIAVKYRALGHTVKYVYATNGDAGHHEMGGAKLAAIRAEEVRNGCAVAGIEYEILDNHDAHLEVNLKLRESFITLIRRFKPDILITHRPNDYHPDHRNTSLLVQDSSYLITVPNVCPMTPPLMKAPVILYMSDGFKRPYEFNADIVIDIDDAMEKKVQILNCHKSQYYEWLPWNAGQLDLMPKGEVERFNWLKEKQYRRDSHVADRFRPELIKRYGNERGEKVTCAEAFEISEYGRHISQDDIESLFPF